MPTPHLVTERLRLRPFSPEDCDALHALWTDPDVRRYLWDDVVVDRDAVMEVIEASERDFDSEGFGFWTLSLPGHETIIGFCGFRHEPRTAEAELVYGIAPPYWGQGLATEAAEGALRHAFETLALDEVIAGTDAPNLASLRVMEKVGMTPRRRFRRRGLEHEQVYYGLTLAAFRERSVR